MSAWLPTTEEWTTIRLTLQVAGAAVLVGLLPAVAVAWILATRSFRGRSIIEPIINLPLVLPPVVTGYVLLVLFGRRGWIGGALEEWFGVRIVFDWKGAAIAAAVMGFPLMVRPIRLAFASIDPRLVPAARTLGARPLDAFLSITLPLSREGILSGCVLAFARSMGEFGATIMIAGSIPGETRTIALEVYQLLESPGGSAAAVRLIVFSIFLAIVALLISDALHGRHRGALEQRQ